MVRRILAMLIGFAFACFAAGLTKVAFWYTPMSLTRLPGDMVADQIAEVVMLAAAIATHSATVAAPFALVGAAIGEWRGIRDWAFYALLGVAIAVVGFFAQYQSEAEGAPTIVNNYALTAFLTAGFVGGLAYWLVAGRRAGGPERPYYDRPMIEVMPPARAPSESTITVRGEPHYERPSRS